MQVQNSVFKRVSILILFLAGSTSLLLSQGSQGGIRGVVTDESGASVPIAEVTLTNLGTNQVINTTTGPSGVYLFTSLPIGDYQLTVQAPGFKTFTRSPVTVVTATTATVDVVLEVGDVTEQVEVVGSPISLKTSSAEVSTIMERKAMMDLPISLGGQATIGASGRRQPENFIFLTPGVTGNQWTKSINGAPRFSAEVLYDGVTAKNMTAPGFKAATSPPYEAIQEFKVQNSLYPVEYGRGFGVLNFSFRSGTNEFHGNVFHFLRNDKLDASGFFNAERPIIRQNEFGGSLGGPVIKNKTFFFFSMTGFELRGGSQQRGLVTIPTQQFRQGDFSAWPLPIFDPSTTRPDGQGSFVRDPFPNNVIPQSQINPVAQATIPMIPDLDIPGAIVNNFVSRQREPTTEYSWSIKGDHNIGNAHRLSFSYWDIFESSKTRFGPVSGPLDRVWDAPSDGGGLRANWSYTVSPTFINDVRFGFTPEKPTWAIFLPDDRRGNETFNIPNIPNDVLGFPTFNFSNGDSFLFGNSAVTGSFPFEDRNWTVVEQATWVKGNHQFKFGFEYRHRENIAGDTRENFGSFNFDRRSVSQPNSPEFNTFGNSFAAFLVGDVFSAQRNFPAPVRTFTDDLFSFYGEDKIQLTPKLTMTLGLRYDLPFFVTEEQDRLSALDITRPNPAAGGLPGALTFFGEGEGRNGITETILGDNYRSAWSPRIAFAYNLDDKTVLRAGYGLFHLFPNVGRIGNFQLFGAGFGAFASVTSTDEGVTPAFNIATEGFPITSEDLGLPNFDPTLVNEGTATFVNPDAQKTGINQSWTLSIQRELPANILLDLAYVGSKNNRLPAGLEDINQVNSDLLRLGQTLLSNVNSTEAAAAGIAPPFPGFRGSVSQALRPFPQFTQIFDVFQPTGFSQYHAFQMRAQKRFSQGSTFLASYTLSKNLGAGGEDSFGDPFAGGGASFRALDTGDRAREKAHLSFDQTHVFVLSWLYELPFGKGKPIGDSWGPVLNHLLGGWQFGAIHRYQSGPTIAVGGGPVIPLFGGGNRPDIIDGDAIRTNVSVGDFDPATDRFLNIDALGQPAPFTFGNAPRRLPNVRAPGFFNEDFSVIKHNRITERVQLQFRAEFFNIFNRTNFGSPGSNINDPSRFGVISSQAGDPRQIQFGLKVIF